MSAASAQDTIARYLELYNDKVECSKELREINKEMRELKPIVAEHLAVNGESELSVGDSKVILTSNPKKLRKSKKLYEADLKEYLKELGVGDIDATFEQLTKLKQGDDVVVADVKVVN